MGKKNSNSDLNRSVRIYDPLHKVKGGKNYYRFMTAFGPCFGGTKKDAAILPVKELLEISKTWPLGCLWEIEEMDKSNA